MVLVYLGLGSNVGDREANIGRAIELIGNVCEVKRVSGLYETEPVGYKEQDWFLNCALEAECDKSPIVLFAWFQAIEKQLKRRKTVKHGPRTIDIDVLFYGERGINAGGFIIPHPRMHERRFVLAPLNELCPGYVHPILKKTVEQLNAELTSADRVEPYRRT
jgi:2-amino-4-hydroxy-6-hydroxymethyldihydropteridine diphosphokinase